MDGEESARPRIDLWAAEAPTSGAKTAPFIPADFPVDLKLILPAVLAVCAVSVGIRYLVLRRKG